MTNNVTRGGKGKSQESAGTLPDALKSLLCVKTPPTACAVLSVCVCVRDDPYFRQNCNETSHHLVLQAHRARPLLPLPCTRGSAEIPSLSFPAYLDVVRRKLIVLPFLRFVMNISLKKNNASHKVTLRVFDAAPINAVLNY